MRQNIRNKRNSGKQDTCKGRFPLPIRSTRSSKFPDQALHNFFVTATQPQQDHSPLLHHFNPTTTLISTRSSRPLIHLYLISTWPDRPCRTGVMGYWSNRGRVDLVKFHNFFHPNQTRSLHDRKKWFPNQLDLYSINTRSLPNGFSSAWLLDLYSNVFDMSKIFG